MAGTPDRNDRDAALVAAEKIARVMDGWFVDPILGMTVPWVGDLVGAGLGLYPLLLAWRRGAPGSLIARMLLNLTFDLVTGAVPVLGDLLDFFFRAHRRNLDLLRARSDRGQVRASGRDALMVAGALTLFLGALAIPIVLLVLAIRALS